ncbi:SseB family protein [Dactylosporangium sp. CA-233914]|uniref:SseB family protein n=1 Tax=Dactylosporangium sp. CA-233914 TaxID=3239934 RepID=UPI003D8BB9B0
MTLPGFADWRPATEAEEAMAAAVAARDELAYCRALSEEALYLPITPAAAAGREPVTLATSPAGGVTYVLAWTSAAALPAQIPAVRRAPLFEIVHTIESLGWGIAVDPGLPLQGFLTPDTIRTLPPWEPQWSPLDHALRAAVLREDRDAYMGALLEAHLILPLPTEEEIAAANPPPDAPDPGDYWTAVRTDRVVPTVSRDVTDPEFPWWRTERVDGQPVVFAFTSVAHMQAEVGDREWIAVPFTDIVVAWPEDAGALRLNPGGSNGMELPPEALARMYGLFLAAMREKNQPREA